MFHDYKVEFRSEEALVEVAIACRRLSGNETMASFNVISFVERVLPLILAKKKKGQLRIQFFDVLEGEKPAFVTYNPLTLHIDREVWELARLGDPLGRFVVAHEVGHILLHDHYAQGFSDDPNQQIKFVQNEERAEWQANTFASHFLLTRSVLNAFSNADEVAKSCDVPMFLAEERFAAAEEEMRRAERCARAKSHIGDFCGNCWNLTLVVQGTLAKCETCGFRKAM